MSRAMRLRMKEAGKMLKHTGGDQSNRLSGDFWKYWTGQTISNLGSSVTIFVFPLLVYKLTGSAVSLAISSAVNILPYLLFGLILGAWADRVDRKRMMVGVDLLRALIIASIPVLAVLDHLSLWWIYAVGFLNTTLTICFNAGQFAAIPHLVKRDDLITANGRIQASYSAAGIAGPLLAGLLVAVMPLTILIFIDAASFAVSALSLALIGISFNDSGDPQERRNIYSDVTEGLRYVLRHPVLRNISLMMALINFVGITITAQLVLFAQQQLQADESQISILYAAQSLGVVALALVAGQLRKRWSFSTVALLALMVYGILTMFLALTHWYWVAVPLVALMAGAGMLFNINTGSLRQAIVPDAMLGRVVSISGVLAWSAIPLGSLAGGFLIGWTQNVALVYGGIGVLYFLIPLAFSRTALGQAERYLPQEFVIAPGKPAS